MDQDKLLKVLLSYNLSTEQCIATESSSYVLSGLGHHNKYGNIIVLLPTTDQQITDRLSTVGHMSADSLPG